MVPSSTECSRGRKPFRLTATTLNDMGIFESDVECLVNGCF